MSCKYCIEYEDLPEHIINGQPIGKVFDTCIQSDENGWHLEVPSGVDIGIKFCPYCGRKLTDNNMRRYNRLKHQIERNQIMLKQLKDRQDSLSVWGYRDMGYYEGRLSVLEDLLDEMEADEI